MFTELHPDCIFNTNRTFNIYIQSKERLNQSIRPFLKTEINSVNFSEDLFFNYPYRMYAVCDSTNKFKQLLNKIVVG